MWLLSLVSAVGVFGVGTKTIFHLWAFLGVLDCLYGWDVVYTSGFPSLALSHVLLGAYDRLLFLRGLRFICIAIESLAAVAMR